MKSIIERIMHEAKIHEKSSLFWGKKLLKKGCGLKKDAGGDDQLVFFVLLGLRVGLLFMEMLLFWRPKKCNNWTRRVQILSANVFVFFKSI